jgi:hypothetical protein
VKQDFLARLSAAQTGSKGKHHGYAHKKNKRRKDEICRCPAIPFGVLDGPVGLVVAARIIHKNHPHNGKDAVKSMLMRRSVGRLQASPAAVSDCARG